VGGREDVPPGRQVAGHPRHKAWHPGRQEIGHAESGVTHEDFVWGQGRAGPYDGPALSDGFMAVAWGSAQDQTPQWQASITDRPDPCDPGQDEGGSGLVSSSVVVLPHTATAPRAEEADHVTCHGAESCIALGTPPPCLLDALGPRLHEGLDGPASRRHRAAPERRTASAERPR
jgi:hypothetical protein